MSILSSVLEHKSPSSCYLPMAPNKVLVQNRFSWSTCVSLTQLHSLYLTLSMVENLPQRAKVVSINDLTKLETALTENKINV